MPLPSFNRRGNLPAGIHPANWKEVEARFGGTVRRRALLVGLRAAVEALAAAGCKTVFLDGSFVTSKTEPNDYDACWDVTGVDADQLDPVFLDFSDGRAAQKRRYLGEFFPAQLPEGASGRTFLEFFQRDRNAYPKGVVALDLTS
jgi:hypothetical protein